MRQRKCRGFAVGIRSGELPIGGARAYRSALSTGRHTAARRCQLFSAASVHCSERRRMRNGSDASEAARTVWRQLRRSGRRQLQVTRAAAVRLLLSTGSLKKEF